MEGGKSRRGFFSQSLGRLKDDYWGTHNGSGEQGEVFHPVSVDGGQSVATTFEHGTTRQLGVSHIIRLLYLRAETGRLSDPHLFPVDGIVGDLEVGLRPGLLVVEPVAEQDDLDGVGQERYGKGLRSTVINGSSNKGGKCRVSRAKNESWKAMTPDAHGGNDEDREVSVEQTGSEAEGGSGVGHCS